MRAKGMKQINPNREITTTLLGANAVDVSIGWKNRITINPTKSILA